MPLYIYECPICKAQKEALIRNGLDAAPVCNKHDGPGGMPVIMVQVLGTPSAPQWHCSAAHSRSKGF